jgi:uncharacterized protein YcbK (DUF882 family)
MMGDLSPNFSRHEFACKCGCGLDTADAETLVMLETIRQHYGVPVTITSGCRCEAHNRAVGGSPDSQHVQCRAADIVVQGVEPGRVQAYCKRIWPGKYGIGSYDWGTHIDSRSECARWSGQSR